MVVLSACGRTASPRDAVLTGTIDQNLVGVAGKPTAVAADGLQKVAIVDTLGNPIGSSKDPCDGSDLKNFAVVTAGGTAVALIPAIANQNAFICSIHVHLNTLFKSDGSNDELISITEGGGTGCATSPTLLDGDMDPAKGLRLASGGNGGFIQGGAGQTIYRTTAPNRAICTRTAGSKPVLVSGTFIRQ